MTRMQSILRFLFRRERVERDIDQELRYHVDRQTELNIAQGMTPEMARREAALTVGGISALKDDCREARTGHLLETIWQDVRYGMRVLTKNPGFSLAAILERGAGR